MDITIQQRLNLDKIRIRGEATRQRRQAAAQAEDLRRQVAKEVGQVEAAAEAEKNRLRREAAASKASRELPGYQISTSGQKTAISAVERQQARVRHEAVEVKEEIAEAVEDTEKSIDKAVSKAVAEIDKQATENAAEKLAFQLANIQLETGEWISKQDYFNNFDPKERALLMVVGLDQYSGIKEQQFKDSTVELKNGERVDKEMYDNLSTSDRRLLWRVGIQQFDKEIKQEYKDSTVRLNNGDRVDKEMYNSLPPAEQKALYDMGVDIYGKVSEAKLKTTTVVIKNGERVDKVFYNGLDSEAKTVLNNKGIDGFNIWVDKKTSQQAQELKAFEAKYQLIGKDDYVDKAWYSTLASEDRNYLKANGLDAYNKKNETEFKKDSIYLQATREYMNKEAFNALPPLFQAVAIEKGVEGLNKYIKDNYTKVKANGDLIDNKALAGLTPAEQSWLTTWGADSYNNMQEAVFNMNNQKLGDGTYVPKATFEALDPADQKQLKVLGVQGFNKYAEEQAAKITAAEIARLPQAAQTFIDKHGLESYNNWIDRAETTDSLQQELGIYEVIGLVPEGSFATGRDANGQIQFRPLDPELAKDKTAWDITRYVAKIIVPGLWAVDWDKMSIGERAINIAVDVVTLGLVFAKPIAGAVRGLPKGLGKTAAAAGKNWRAVAKISKTIKTTALMDSKTAAAVQKAIQASKVADLKFITALSRVTKLTSGQLAKLEKLTKIKGLAKITKGVSTAQTKLTKAWKVVGRAKIGTKKYGKAIAKVEAAQNNLAKAISRYEAVMKPRHNAAWYQSEWQYILKNTERELNTLTKHWAAAEKSATPAMRKSVLQEIRGMEDTLSAYKQAAKAGEMPPPIKSWKIVNIKEKVTKPVLFDDKPYIAPAGGAPGEVVAVASKPSVGLRFETTEVIKTGLKPLAYEEARPLAQLAIPAVVKAPTAAPIILPKPEGAPAAITSTLEQTTAAATAIQVEINKALASLKTTAVKAYVKAITKPILAVIPAASASVRSGVTTVASSAVNTAIQAAVDTLTKTAAKNAIKTSAAQAVATLTSAATKTAVAVYTTPIVSNATTAYEQVLPRVKTLTSTAIKATTAVTAKTATATKAAAAAKAAAAKAIKVGKIARIVPFPPPFILPPGAKDKRAMTKAEIKGAVQWKQGLFYIMLYPPYGKLNIDYSSKPFAGIKIADGLRSAYATIRRVGGELPPVIKRDMGIMDVVITTPKGGKPKIAFKRDNEVIRQSTKV